MDQIKYEQKRETEETYTRRYEPADREHLLPDWILDLKKYFGWRAKREYFS